MTRDFPIDLDVLKEVIDHLNVGVYITDTERRILLWNRKAEEITGHRADDVVGTHCHAEVLNHMDADGNPLCTTDLCPLHLSMTQDLENDRPVVVYIEDPRGERVALQVTVGPLRDAEGRVVGGVEAFQDVTSRMHDMERAREIQQRLMPQDVPEVPGARVQVLYQPQGLIGGDLYDLRTLSDGRLELLLADMRGHGVSAALSTTWLSALRRDIAQFAGHPQGYLRALNARLCGPSNHPTFSTACYAVYDPDDSNLTYGLAGHPPPVLWRAESSVAEHLDGHGMPFGIDPDQSYGEDTVRLEPGDAVIFYTDGITEAFDEDGHVLGTEALAELFAESLDASDVPRTIYRHVLQRSGGVDLEDDVTLVVLHRT